MKDRGRWSQASVEERYTQWKSLVPILYDWFANHNLVWPSLSCRWGQQLEQATYKTRQRLYLSEQASIHDIAPFVAYLRLMVVFQILVIANCEIVKPRVAAAEHISQFNEEARSPFVKKFKTIIHPGECLAETELTQLSCKETRKIKMTMFQLTFGFPDPESDVVNRIRELPQNNKIVATHTDSPNVLIWDVEVQPNRHAVLGAADSRPDLILAGHQENAEFALAMCPTEPFVLSGGKDKLVVLWSICDHISTSATDTSSTKSPGTPSGASILKQTSKTSGSSEKAADGPSIGPRGVYQGHEDTVEDVQFCPSSSQVFCSVGVDSCLILWDAHVGSTPSVKVEKAHNADLHCVEWNPHDENFILTGSADNSVHMFDRRNLTPGGVGSPVYKFESHKAAVLCVQWSLEKASVFGSAAADGFVSVWDYEKVSKKKERVGTRMPNSPPGLFFQHAGHRDKVVDFHWNASDPWTIVSASDDCGGTGGGQTLQIWRMSDLIYRPEEEVLAELENFKSHMLSCSSRS